MAQNLHAHNASKNKDKTPENPSAASLKSRRYRYDDYALVSRIVNRHLVVTAPDFNMPIPVVVPFDPPTPQQGGRALLAAWIQIAEYLKGLDGINKSHPAPKKPKEAIPHPLDTITLRTACLLLAMKPDMVRGLADSGAISTTRTPGGHRRFSRKKIEEYLLATCEGSETDIIQPSAQPLHA